MRDYLAFTHSHIAELREDPYSEGGALATDCLDQLGKLNNPERFPPTFLILLTSPRYCEPDEAECLLNGIHDKFVHADPGRQEVPLIGCDVAAVFCDLAVYRKGALLLCLASRLLTVRIGVGDNARRNPKLAVETLLGQLELGPVGGVDPNSLANRLLLTFLPGFKAMDGEEFYPAPELHRHLRAGVQARIGLAGGVCSVGDADLAKDGLLYSGRHAYRDAVVAASIDSGIPIGVALSYGVESTGKVLRVTEVAEDRRTILAFDKCSPEQLFGQGGEGVLLVKLSTDGELTIDLPQLARDRKSLHVLHRVCLNDYFQVMKPDREKILERFVQGFNRTRARILIERPIACLTIFGQALNNCFRPFFDISGVLEFAKQERIACVGGFFDGELGLDETGRSLFVNGASSCLIFGDEMSERTPLYQGMTALAEFGPLLNNSDRIIEGVLEIVLKTGFPGAMLSLILPDRGGDYIVAQSAKGSRFEKIVDMTRRALASHDILAEVARENKPRFIADSRQDQSCGQEAIRAGGIVSQYVLPLKRLDGAVFGILQVDLGELRHRKEAEFFKTEKAKVLNSLAEIFESGLNRITNEEATRIVAQLDQALYRSLSAASVEDGLQQFIEEAVRIFGVDMAHVRLAQPEGALAGGHQEPHLTLVAGFGPFYEAGKVVRREVSASDKSLIYAAFRGDGVTIVNDVASDGDYKALCSQVAGNADLTAALGQMKSYAAMAFRNEKGQKLGAFSLAAEKPWFFAEHLERAVQSLGQRIAFLIEHLRAKNRLEFLFKVSTRLAEIDLDEMPLVLANALTTFSEAIKAEVASLYLWDEDRKRFVLQAEHGWKDPEWIGAAHYRKEDTWIGVRALKKQPLYIANLYDYYQDNPGRPGERRGQHAESMFGFPLSPAFTVEAISLPLKIGKKRFGVMTVYRRIKAGESTGFLTTDTELLAEGAYKMAGLVNALVQHRNDRLRHQEQDRQRGVYEAISALEVGDGFEAQACQQVLKAYRAGEATFYKADEPDGKTVSWIVGYTRNATTGELAQTPRANPDKLVRGAASNALGDEKQKRATVSRRQLTPKQRDDPQAVAAEGLVERARIPLMSARRLVGVLDLKWDVPRRGTDSFELLQGFINLRQVGQLIGSVYRQHQLAKEAEQGKLAVQATGAYVFQRAHRLINAIQTLYRISQEIEQAKTEDQRREKIKALKSKADEYVETINWTMDLGERVQSPAREKLPVQNLLLKGLSEIDTAGRAKTEISVTIPDELLVLGSPELVKEIFVNLLNNAFEAMEGRDSPKLHVSASVHNDRRAVDIVFDDNGIGMTPEEIRNAERGFVVKGRHKGNGVLISRVMAIVQGGSLRYESEKWNGTRATVSLPLGSQGDVDLWRRIP
jgi:signal transduction histidine kinase